MKFTVSSQALQQLLATTGKVISNKNTFPILDYFLLELNGEELKVTTSDLETTIMSSITVDSAESDGVVAAPAKLMLDTLKEFADMHSPSRSTSRCGRSRSVGIADRRRSLVPTQ